MAQAAAQRAAAPRSTGAAAAQRATRSRPTGRRTAAAPGQRAAAAHAPQAAAAPQPAARREQQPAAGLPRYLRDSTAAGQPLPAGLQREMEGRFGAPLADVRVHTGAGAAASAAAAGAQAYTAGSDIVFGDGPAGSRFAPGTADGRSLLAHELTHVVQQRRAGTTVSQHSAADGGARRGADEHEAEANARRVAGTGALTAVQPPAALLQKSDDDEAWYETAGAFVVDTAGAGAELVGDVAGAGVELVGDAAMALVRRVAPQLVPVIERGPMALLREMVSAALDGVAGALNALDPGGTLTAMFTVFTGLVGRAIGITTALLSGECQPLLDALDQLKTFVTEVAGAAWDRLTSFLQPVGDFFSDLWTGGLQPGVAWLQDAAGDVWAGITQFGQDIWDWTEPVRDAVGGAWDWVKEQLFGPDDAGSADSSGGIVGWISTKAGEAWDWVKEETAPVWQPIADVAQRVGAMLPPPFLAGFGAQMQGLSTQLDSSATAMAGGEGVAEQRETLATVLPSVGMLIGMARGVIAAAGAWVSDSVAAVGGAVSGMLGALRNSLFSALAGRLSWLEDAALRFTAWAEAGVGQLFTWLLAGFDALTPFIQNAAGVVQRLIGVAGDLMRLPQLVLSTVWNLIPCCIREPVKNFLFTQILGRIPVFGQFFSDPTLWPRVQATALRILRQAFVDGDLAGAAWSFFQAVLRLLGLPPELVVQVLAKAAQAIGDILLNPVGFLIHLLGAVRAGFGRFFENIGTHLLNGVSGWLFGQAQQAGITPPQDFSVASIFGFVLQVLGVSVEHVFERLAAKLDPAVVRRLRQIYRLASGVWGFLTVLIEQGPAGLWAEIQTQLGNLWDTVVQGVVSWVTEAVVNRAMRWLLALLDVTGIMPVINAMVAVYNAIESFVQYLREMLEIVSRVLDGVLDIAQGAIDTAAGFLVDALSRAMPVAIGFLANQFGLGRLGERLHELLETVRAVVDRAIDWLLDRAIAGGRALLEMARSGAAAVGSAVRGALAWLGLRVGFTAADGTEHHLRFEGGDARAPLMVESRPQRFSVFLDSITAPALQADKALAQRLFDELRVLQDEAATAPEGSDVGARITNHTNQLAQVAARLMPATSAAGVPAATPPVFGGLQAGFGSSVVVHTLTSNMPPGDGPRVEGGRWDDLRRRITRSGGRSVYVRGHLLNHHIGGPGHSWNNLTPLTQEANNGPEDSMLRGFETRIKQAVDAGQPVRDFTVTVGAGRLSSATQLGEVDAELATTTDPAATERLRSVRRVLVAEECVPQQVSMRAEILRPAAAGAAAPAPEVVSHSVTNAPSRDWRLYALRPG